MKLPDWPIFELLVSLLVLMAMFAGAKLILSHLPDGGLLGNIKNFFMLA